MSNTGNPLTVARLIASTKRKKRNSSIKEIADDILSLKKEVGDINTVAKLVGISAGMLNQFLSFYKLPVSVQQLVEERKIDSVAMVFNLSKFNDSDANILAEMILQNKMTSQELKVLLPFRRKNITEDIRILVDRVYGSKNIKVSVIRVPDDVVKDSVKLTQHIKGIVGEKNYVGIEKIEKHCDIKVTKEGEGFLRKAAKEKGLALHELISRLLSYG